MEPTGHNDSYLTCGVKCAGTHLEFLHRRPWGLVRLVGQFKAVPLNVRVNQTHNPTTLLHSHNSD